MLIAGAAKLTKLKALHNGGAIATLRVTALSFRVPADPQNALGNMAIKAR